MNYYGAIFVVVAKNVNNEASVDTRDPVAISNAIGTRLTTQTVKSIDKNTGATVSGTTILKVNNGGLIFNNTYDAKNHGFTNKVATPIKAV